MRKGDPAHSQYIPYTSGSLVEQGVQISFAPWRYDANTYEEQFFIKEERRVQIYGLPYHLWSRENFTKIGDHVGKAVGIYSHILDLTKLDAARIKVEANKVCIFDPITVSDGIKKYRITIFLNG